MISPTANLIYRDCYSTKFPALISVQLNSLLKSMHWEVIPSHSLSWGHSKFQIQYWWRLSRLVNEDSLHELIIGCNTRSIYPGPDLSDYCYTVFKMSDDETTIVASCFKSPFLSQRRKSMSSQPGTLKPITPLRPLSNNPFKNCMRIQRHYTKNV